MSASTLSAAERMLVRPYAAHGVDFDGRRDDEILADSPFDPSGASDKFHFNVKKNSWHDKKLGENAGGGVPQFLDAMQRHVYGPALWADAHRERLARLAKHCRLPSQAFETWRDVLGYDERTDRYTLLLHDPATDLPATIRWWWWNVRIVRGKERRERQENMTLGTSAGMFGVLALPTAPDRPVYLCEGESDAIAMAWLLRKAKKSGVAVAAPGATTFKAEWAAAFNRRNVRVMYDHDDAGRRGDAVVTKRLASYVNTLTYLHWPEDTRSGHDVRDEVIAARKVGTADAYRACASRLRGWLATEPRTEPKTIDDNTVVRGEEEAGALADLMRSWIYCVVAKRFVGPLDVEQGMLTGHLQQYDKEAFSDKFRKVCAPFDGRERAAALLMMERGCRMVDHPDYRPGEPLFVKTERDQEVINLYQPSPLLLLEQKPYRLRSIKPYLDHLRFVIPERRIRRLVMSWIAFLVRQPESKPNWAVALGGMTRLGKSLIFYILERMLGGPKSDGGSVVEPGIEEILKPQNDYLVGAKLLVIDTQDEDSRASLKTLLRKIQAWITVPPKYLRINGKFKVQFDILNTLAVLVMTHKQFALPFETHDARFLYYWSNSAPREDALIAGTSVGPHMPYPELQRYANGRYEIGERKTYIEVMWDWMRDHEQEVAHYFLYEHQMAAEFNPITPPPATDAKAQSAQANEDPVMQALRQAFDEQRKPFKHDLITTHEVLQWLADRGQKLSSMKLGPLLRDLGVLKLGKDTHNDKRITTKEGRSPAWAVRGHERFKWLTDAQLTAEWTRQRRVTAKGR